MTDHIGVWGYDVNGLMDGPMIFIGTTTTSSGVWSIDYSGVGFTEAPMVTATLILADTDVYDRGFASMNATPTTTGASGYGLRGQNIVVGGSSLRTVPDGTVVHIIAIGETFTPE